MNIGVSGHLGFIGKNLMPFLSQIGHEVEGCDIKGGSTLAGDVGHPGTAQCLTDDKEAVVHLAALPGIPTCHDFVRPAFDQNIGSLLGVLEAAAESDTCKHVVFASSAAADSCDSIYGAMKSACENLCLGFSRAKGLRTTVLRFSNVYGPHSAHKSSVVARFMSAVLAGEALQVYGDGGDQRDFIHVQDICSAIRAVLVDDEDEGWNTYRISTNIMTSVRELALMTMKAADVESVPIDYKEPRAGDVRDAKPQYYLPTPKHWEAGVDLQRGLETTWKWFQRQAVPA